jgi:hypothetical protein
MLVAPSCLAQEITVLVMNADDGRPMRKVSMTVSALRGETPLRSDGDSLSLKTDLNGEAHFTLPNPAPPHIIVNVDLPSSRWDCLCLVTGFTKDVIQKGFVSKVGEMKISAPVKATPGQILVPARRMSFFQRLYWIVCCS